MWAYQARQDDLPGRELFLGFDPGYVEAAFGLVSLAAVALALLCGAAAVGWWGPRCLAASTCGDVTRWC